MEYDVIVIGAGLAGLAAASLLAKRGLTVAVVEHTDSPGGTCGSFKRGEAVFDQGAAMLYGFGESGFNAHRFLFNCLEEPIQMIKHELLYVVHYQGKVIRFWPDIDHFIEELSTVFPGQGKNIRRFYRKMKKCYTHVISENPNYTTPDETDPKEALGKILRHPLSYLRFLSYLNISAEKLLKQYFTDPEILRFFNKLTSTYCYATLKEAPAILASVMFIDNHVGGSFYPAGSTLFLPGKLEKVIEEHGGQFYYERTATRFYFDEEGLPKGVYLADGECLLGKNLIYSGTVWNLYKNLLPKNRVCLKERKWALNQIPTYPSVVLYALVDASIIPHGTCPVEMLALNPFAIDESEITIYLSSIDDHTLCPSQQHTLIAIGPSLRVWAKRGSQEYEEQKKEEADRMIKAISKHFPLLPEGLISYELATPQTIERYTLKNGGAAAGPKQMLGQHMLQRQSIRTRWDSLFVCGESTTMGTGTPTVTTSGIAAANAILRKLDLKPFVWEPGRKDYVRILTPPVERGWLTQFHSPTDAKIMSLAAKCYYCSSPSCCDKSLINIPQIMRRITCGNFIGAAKEMNRSELPSDNDFFTTCENNCIQVSSESGAVDIKQILTYIQNSVK